MSNAQEIKPPSLTNLFKTGSLFQDDVLAAPPAHPYPGWKPKAGGDSSALLPYVDDDLRDEKEPSNPVGTGLTWIDRAHLAADAALNGGTDAMELGEHATHFLSGEAGLGRTVFGGLSAVAAPLSIAGGGIDIYEGWKEVNGAKNADERAYGSVKMAEGGVSVVGGGSGLAALGGSSLAASASAGAGAAAVGLAIGHHGDNKVKDLGWLHDDEGSAVSASEWAGNLGHDADQWMTKHGHPHLGTAAGVATTLGASVAGAGMAVGAIPVDAGHKLGASLAKDARIDHYAHYDVDIDGGAKSLAEYDDAQREASQHAVWNRAKGAAKAVSK